MATLKNTEREVYFFRRRMTIAVAMVLFCFLLLFLRLVWLQGIKHKQYAAMADDNRIAVLPIAPNRGLILDRNGVILASNYAAYTLEISSSRLHDDLDTVIDELSKLISIQPRDRKKFKKLLNETRNADSLPLRSRLTDEEVARFTVQRFRFPGVEIQPRLFRQYPLKETASHVIGYIGRINEKDLEHIEAQGEEDNYVGTNHIGKEGLEKKYERELHGLTGYEEMEVSANGKAIRMLSRNPAVSGNNLILSIDIALQKIVEDAFGDRRGAFVAIEPATGDVLAYVSKPTYDPNLFVDGIDQQSWDELNHSPDHPLVNRPLSGAYPPGSTYKPFMALAALELGKRTPNSVLADPGYFVLGNHRFRDQKPGGHGLVNLHKSIVESCDTYYYLLANDLGVDVMHDFMKPFGFGQKTGIDLEHERTGVLPSTEWKRKAYKHPAQQKWYAGETISLGIGQGYNSFTPLQIAQATAILANDGVVMKPHLVKAIEDSATRKQTLTVPKESYRIKLKPEHLAFVKNAMAGVTKGQGTAAWVFHGAGYESAGKTGTAQVVGMKANEKYDEKRIAEYKRDHSLYIAFAPPEKPRIALMVIVENGGFGAVAAGPIARKALDYYLLGKKPPDKAAPTAGKASRTTASPKQETVARPAEKRAPATEATAEATVKDGTE